jgi:hypothetical protein
MHGALPDSCTIVTLIDRRLGEAGPYRRLLCEYVDSPTPTWADLERLAREPLVRDWHSPVPALDKVLVGIHADVMSGKLIMFAQLAHAGMLRREISRDELLDLILCNAPDGGLLLFFRHAPPRRVGDQAVFNALFREAEPAAPVEPVAPTTPIPIGKRDRVIAYIRAMPAGQLINRKQLAAQLGCSVDTIRRAIEELQPPIAAKEQVRD